MRISLLALLLLAAPFATAQTSLHDEIAQQDKAMFEAFNAHDAGKLQTYFSEDLEFYHDKEGLNRYAATMKAFREIFSRNDGLRRDLAGSIEVHPIGTYGALEIGSHRFCHQEHGKDDCGTFKFVHLWQKKDSHWKVTRVISYGH